MTDQTPLTDQQLDDIAGRWTPVPHGERPQISLTGSSSPGVLLAALSSAPEDVRLLLAEVRRQRTQVISIEGAADRYATRANEYQAALEATVIELLAVQVERDAARAEVARLRARTLTDSEYDAAWHAVEGAAGEEGADPGTVLHAVLDRLGITWATDEETHVVADDSDDPEHVDDCPGCAPAAAAGVESGTGQ
ncbi:hypothetical protein ADK57_32155 [Streptomyces sp. MMG1533]|uniref:hypothetical protein n=1 Tax=Streptomyces sp. MMG1533 TaxID=1415546 RepID=UPI0006AF935E|nr:hypothetical protein [Streptomyces sp. MMG1533]KOU59919.1 hypothetical protein ADK57_32155 [Streptomyces sp. MMG1533]